MKAIRRNLTLQALILAILIPAMALLPQSARSNPSGGTVIHGEVNFNLNGDTLDIIQQSDKSIIHWENFSIGANEATIFSMPSRMSASLNRVTGPNASAIEGALRANGNVWLLNPNGILFGPGSVIDVGGLLASTLNVSDDDFLNGGSFYLSGNSTAPVINMGKITVADGGEVYLAAQTVENHGEVLGGVDSRVVFLGGSEILVHSGQKGNIIVSGAQAGGAHVLQNGRVQASEVHLEAYGNNIGSVAVHNPGAIRANKASTEGGRVLLKATQGAVTSNGSVDASGDVIGGEIIISGSGPINVGGLMSVAGNQAGAISLVGSEIAVAPGALLDASGSTSGGAVALASHGMTSIEGEVKASSSLGRGGTVSLSGGEVQISQSGSVNTSGEIGGGAATVTALNSAGINGSIISQGGSGAGGVIELSAASVVLNGSLSASSQGAAGGTVELAGASISTGAASRIDVSGADGGTALLDSSGSTVVSGLVDARGTSGDGGLVGVTGSSVIALGSSAIDASGRREGGEINFGGGFQGLDSRFRNSRYTAADPGARFSANGEVGNGGLVAIWSDGVTDFQGGIDARGGINGGLVEVSGVRQLGFSGSVNASGLTGQAGTLLLDPVNVTVGTGAGKIDPGQLKTVLEGNTHVVIHTAVPTGGIDPLQEGDITIDDFVDLRYNSAATLSFFAHDDIRVGGIVKNHGSGNINLFGGWDGTGSSGFTNPVGSLGSQSHAPSGAISAAMLLQPTNFGNWGTAGRGDITFNPNTNSIANVGSAHGETNVFGASLRVNTGDNPGEFSQIGYRPEDLDNGATVAGTYLLSQAGVSPTGNINVYTTGNVVMLSGDAGRYTHIGHGGANNDNVMTGTAPWQIEVPDVDLSGNITVHAGREILLLGGTGDGGYSMIGHGGHADDTTAADPAAPAPPYARNNRDFRRIDASGRGNISVRANFLEMLALGAESAVQIGHGGYSVHGEHAGHITVVATAGVNAQAAGSTIADVVDGYVMIGHGGSGIRDAGATVPSLQLAERGADHQYTLPVDFDGTSGFRFGPDGVIGGTDDFGEEILTANVANTLIANNGAGSPWAPGGTGAAATSGTFNSSLLPLHPGADGIIGTADDILPLPGVDGIYGTSDDPTFHPGLDGIAGTSDDINFLGSAGAYRQVGAAGNIHVTSSNGSVVFNAGGSRSFAKIGHGGYYTAGEFGGWDIDNADGDNNWSTGADGDITISAAGDVVFDRVINGAAVGGNVGAFAQVGHGGLYSAGGGHGNISVTAAAGRIAFYGGRSENNGTNPNPSFAQIGHGGVLNYDGADTTANENARTHEDSYAHGTHSGNITVNAGSDILFRSGFGGLTNGSGIGYGSYSMIGHGGWRHFAQSREGFSGNIVVNSGGNIDFYSGQRTGEPLRTGQFQQENNPQFAPTMIGHGGMWSRGDHWGSIAVTSAGDIKMEASAGWVGVSYGNAAATTGTGTNHDENGDADIVGAAGGGNGFSGIPGYGFGQNAQFNGQRNFTMIGHGGWDSEHQMLTTGDLGSGGSSGSNSVGMGVLGLLTGHVWDGAPLALGDSNRVESDITVTAGGDLVLTAALEENRGVQSSSFLSYDWDGPTGTLDVPFNDPIMNALFNGGQIPVRLTLPEALPYAADSFALIGHGGRSTEIRQGLLPGGANPLYAGHYGDITLTVGGSIDMRASDIARGSERVWTVGDGDNDPTFLPYFDLPFWLDAQDGVLDGASPGTGSIPAIADLTTIFTLYNFNDALADIVKDGNVMTLGEFVYTRTNGANFIFGDSDDGGGGIQSMSQASDPVQNFVQIGHGGLDSTDGAMQGNISVVSTGGGLNLLAGAGNNNFAHIGHGGDDGGADRYQPVRGDISIDVNGPVVVKGGARNLAFAQIGHGGSSFNSNVNLFEVRDSDISVRARSGNITVSGGDFTARDYVSASNLALLNQAAQYGMIGHGGWDGDMDIDSNIQVRADLGSLSILGTENRGNFAKVGHGGSFFDNGPTGGIGSTFVGNIQVDVYGNISLAGGNSPTEYIFTQLTEELNYSSIDSGANADPIFTSIPGYYPSADFHNEQHPFAQIGHGGRNIGNTGRGVTITGDILVNTATMARDANADITLTAGDADGAFALIGHGGVRTTEFETASGKVTVNAPRDITLKGAPRFFNGGTNGATGFQYNSESFAQIGHAIVPDTGGRIGNTNGDVTVTAGRDILLQAGGGVIAHAIIGNGSTYSRRLENNTPTLDDQTGSHTGNVTVVSGGNLTLKAATPNQADLGNLNNIGGLLIPVDGMFTSQPGGFMSVAQIGNGGPGVNSQAGGHTGNIDVRVGGSLTMTSGDVRNGYAKIGHGDYMFSDRTTQSGLGVREGSITVAVGESATLTGAMIGHVADRSISTAISLDGNTYVAVGRKAGASGATLKMEALPASAPAPPLVSSYISSGLIGELRLYMPGRAQNAIGAGMFLNNTGYILPLVPPLRSDEQYASEFTFTYNSAGLPQGMFTPAGTYLPSGFGQYVIFYGASNALPPSHGGGGGGSNGGVVIERDEDGNVIIVPQPPVTPEPSPVIPPLPPNPFDGLSDTYFGSPLPTEFGLLLDAEYNYSVGLARHGASESQMYFNISGNPLPGSAAGSSLPGDPGTITIHGLDQMNGATTETQSVDDDEVRRRALNGAPAPDASTAPAEPVTPPQESMDPFSF